MYCGLSGKSGRLLYDDDRSFIIIFTPSDAFFISSLMDSLSLATIIKWVVATTIMNVITLMREFSTVNLLLVLVMVEHDIEIDG